MEDITAARYLCHQASNFNDDQDSADDDLDDNNDLDDIKDDNDHHLHSDCLPKLMFYLDIILFLSFCRR